MREKRERGREKRERGRGKREARERRAKGKVERRRKMLMWKMRSLPQSPRRKFDNNGFWVSVRVVTLTCYLSCRRRRGKARRED